MKEFPQFRKYAHGRSWFKVSSDDFFEEWQVMGVKVLHHKIEAKTYPEKLLIMDMLACKDGLWEEVSEEELLEWLANYSSSSTNSF